MDSALPYVGIELIARTDLVSIPPGSRLPRTERTQTHLERYLAREFRRGNPRHSGWSINQVTQAITGRSRIGRNR